MYFIENEIAVAFCYKDLHFWKKQFIKTVEKSMSPHHIDQTCEILLFLAFGS